MYVKIKNSKANLAARKPAHVLHRHLHQHLHISLALIMIIKPSSPWIPSKQATSLKAGYSFYTASFLHSILQRPPTQHSDMCTCTCSNPRTIHSTEHWRSLWHAGAHCAPLIDANLRPSWRSRLAVVGKVRWEELLICVAWERFQVHFAVDYSLARWCQHFDSAALTERLHLKKQASAKATE